jgi:hypothetical protein
MENRSSPKRAVRSTSQLNEFKKVKKSKLPIIQSDFNSRIEAGLSPKANKIWEEVDAYVKDLVKYVTLAREAPRSSEAIGAMKDKERAERELEEAQKLIYSIRDRCIHSVVYPELYTKLIPSAQEELYLYWTTLAQFNRDSWCEYYSLGTGYSRFFMVNRRKHSEVAALGYELFSLLTRFANMFSFDSEADSQIFSLYLDGFDPVCIADFVGETKNFVEKKIAKFTEVALQHREEFFKLSEMEQDEIMEERE